MTSEKKPCEIVISEEKLREVNSIEEAEAKKIFESSTGATVNGKQAKVTRDQNSITVSVDDLADRPRIIALTKDNENEIVAFFGYDSDSGTLLPKKEQDQIDPIVVAIKNEATKIKEGFDEVAQAIIDKKKATK
jgi:hypothetical protein